MEDWKKKYEDAIIGIKAVYENADAATRAALETKFPGLAESEDERIRKELYEFIKVNSPKEYANRFIAWLEKQKEQKPVEWSDADYEARNEIMIMLIHSGKTPLASWFSKAFPFERKQEWSEKDEKIFNHIIYCAEERGWIPFNEIEWLKSRFKSLRPQPHWKPSDK